VVCAVRWNDGEEAGHGMGYPEMRGSWRIACVFLFWFVLSVSFCLFVSSVSFGFYGEAPGAGEVLYIRGVDRLGEKNKHKHFYLSTRVPFHCE
jgi:hypothetical protein